MMLKNGYEIVLQLPVVKYDSILEKPDFFQIFSNCDYLWSAIQFRC